jgi:hypothetical protein
LSCVTFSDGFNVWPRCLKKILTHFIQDIHHFKPAVNFNTMKTMLNIRRNLVLDLELFCTEFLFITSSSSGAMPVYNEIKMNGVKE